MDLDLYRTPVAICRLGADAAVPEWATRSSCPLGSITRTSSELSIVVPQRDVPPDVVASRGWRAFAVLGPLPFHLVGVLASLAVPLAAGEVSIFAISTHDTDWLLVPEDHLLDACAALEAAGHRIHRGDTADPTDPRRPRPRSSPT